MKKANMTREEVNEYVQKELTRALEELRNATKSAITRTGTRAPEEMYEGLKVLSTMLNQNEMEQQTEQQEEEKDNNDNDNNTKRKKRRIRMEKKKEGEEETMKKSEESGKKEYE